MKRLPTRLAAGVLLLTCLFGAPPGGEAREPLSAETRRALQNMPSDSRAFGAASKELTPHYADVALPIHAAALGRSGISASYAARNVTKRGLGSNWHFGDYWVGGNWVESKSVSRRKEVSVGITIIHDATPQLLSESWDHLFKTKTPSGPRPRSVQPVAFFGDRAVHAVEADGQVQRLRWQKGDHLVTVSLAKLGGRPDIMAFAQKVHAAALKSGFYDFPRSLLEQPIQRKPAFEVRVTLSDRDHQFTPSDRARLTVAIEAGPGSSTLEDCSVSCRLVGPLTEGDAPAVWFDDGHATERSESLRLPVQPSTTRSVSFPLRSASATSSKRAASFDKQWTKDTGSWVYRNLVRIPNAVDKPAEEKGVQLADMVQLKVVGRTQPGGPLHVLVDEVRSIHDEEGGVARLAYPDFRPVVGQPRAAAEQLAYYANGDIGDSPVGNQWVRALALRAARFGKMWKTNEGVFDKDPPMPDTPDRVVENVAWFVIQALNPKGAPGVIWPTDQNAKDLWERAHGFDKLPPDGKRTSLAFPSFVCQEHALLFGTLLRALGFPVRDVNVMTYYILEANWQDASNEVWYHGRWNYWGLFDYAGRPPTPFRDHEKFYGRKYDGYSLYVGVRGFDPSKSKALSRFNVGGYVLSAWDWEKTGLWVHDKRLGPDREMIAVSVHSPVAAVLTLQDGRRIGMSAAPVGDPHKWFFGDRAGLIDEIPGAAYYPEGFDPGGLQPADSGPSPQQLLVPVARGTRLADVRLELTGTGDGKYRVEMRHENAQGVQMHEPRAGSVRTGERIGIDLGRFVAKGPRVQSGAGSTGAAVEPTPDSTPMAEPAYLGVHTHAIGPILAAALGIPEGEGVVVGNVVPDTPASRAGLVPFDVITRFDGHVLKTRRDLQRAARRLQAGARVAMDVKRLGRVTVTLAERPAPMVRKLPEQEYFTAKTTEEIVERMRERWKQGYRLSSIAGKDGTWFVVLTQEAQHELQLHKTSTTWQGLRETFAAHWDAGWDVRDVAYDGTTWLAIYRKLGTDRKQAVVTRQSRTELTHEVEARWKDGYKVTSLVRGNGVWAAVFTEDPGLGRQRYVNYTGWEKVKQGIRDAWADKRYMTSAARDGDVWFVVFSQSGFRGQRWTLRSGADLRERIKEAWAEGYRISAVAPSAQHWLVVLSKPK